jgi:hypothetical protein
MSLCVTLCGSTRFESEFVDAQRELSRAGIAFFSLAVLPANRAPDEDWSDGSYDKIVADLMYFDRILRSDAILVLGDGYIGMSTAREILWADIQGKGIAAHRAGSNWPTTIERLKMAVYLDRSILLRMARTFFEQRVDPTNPPTPRGVPTEHRKSSFASGSGRVTEGDRVELLNYAGSSTPLSTGRFGTLGEVFQDGDCCVKWDDGQPPHQVKWHRVRKVGCYEESDHRLVPRRVK